MLSLQTSHVCTELVFCLYSSKLADSILLLLLILVVVVAVVLHISLSIVFVCKWILCCSHVYWSELNLTALLLLLLLLLLLPEIAVDGRMLKSILEVHNGSGWGFCKHCNGFDVRGSVHHSTIHEEKSNKMQQCIKILLFPIYMKFNMFRATHRPSSGA
jgi:hypothetical protein